MQKVGIMGIGYVLGCLLSIILWKIDRKTFTRKIDSILLRVFKNIPLLRIIEVLIIVLACIGISLIKATEIQNFITAFIVIDISNTEKKNLEKREKLKFYDSISLITEAILCGFLCPLFYIIIFGNVFGTFYSLLFYVFTATNFNLLGVIFTFLNIIPSFFCQVLFYIIYIIRNRTWKVDFKGDYFKNSIINPILNLDILAAYNERVNFYYHYTRKGMDYIKNYGDYKGKIDNDKIKNYLNIAYSTCMIIFALFYYIKYKI